MAPFVAVKTLKVSSLLPHLLVPRGWIWAMNWPTYIKLLPEFYHSSESAAADAIEQMAQRGKLPELGDNSET